MEEEEYHRLVCKFCGKSFPNGKSLGGHMRCHLALISASKRVEQQLGLGTVRVSDHDEEKTQKTGKGLRENPKKSWRVSEPKFASNHHCKNCGKGFCSLRALAGHMKSHSMQKKKKMMMTRGPHSSTNLCRKCNKSFCSMRALYGHLRSHSRKRSRNSIDDDEEEEEGENGSKFEQLITKSVRKKRSSTRYMSISTSTANVSMSSSLNSIVVPISETEEVEELAMCLIMLSRDERGWDNVVHPMIQTAHIGPEVCVSDCGYYANGENKFEIGDLDSGSLRNGENKVEFGDLDSGSLRNGENKVEFGDLDSGSSRNGENKVEFGDLDSGSLRNGENKVEFGDFDSGFSRNGDARVEFGDFGSESFRNCDIAGVGFGDFGSGCSRNGGKNQTDEISFSGSHLDGGCKFKNQHELGLEKDLVTETESGVGLVEKCCKSRKKSRSNVQDFGIRGKSKSHDQENVNNATSSDSEVLKDFIRKDRSHKCPICFKSFGSGPALGGHKRKHYNELTTSVNTEFPDTHKLIDLNNLPANLEDGSSADIGFKFSWVGSDIERETLVIVN